MEASEEEELIVVDGDIYKSHGGEEESSTGRASAVVARAGKTEVVKYLLQCAKSLELDINDDAGNRAIDYAIKNNRQDIVSLLNGKNI